MKKAAIAEIDRIEFFIPQDGASEQKGLLSITTESTTHVNEPDDLITVEFGTVHTLERLRQLMSADPQRQSKIRDRTSYSEFLQDTLMRDEE